MPRRPAVLPIAERSSTGQTMPDAALAQVRDRVPYILAARPTRQASVELRRLADAHPSIPLLRMLWRGHVKDMAARAWQPLSPPQGRRPRRHDRPAYRPRSEAATRRRHRGAQSSARSVVRSQRPRHAAMPRRFRILNALMYVDDCGWWGVGFRWLGGRWCRVSKRWAPFS
jgi:hypothetical protein